MDNSIMTCIPKPKRFRAVNYNPREKRLLLHLFSKFNDILELKQNDSATIRKKKQAWEEIAQLFNAHSNSGIIRDKWSLRRLHENNKKRNRDWKMLSKVNQELSQENFNNSQNNLNLNIDSNTKAVEVINFGMENLYTCVSDQTKNDCSNPVFIDVDLVKVENKDGGLKQTDEDYRENLEPEQNKIHVECVPKNNVYEEKYANRDVKISLFAKSTPNEYINLNSVINAPPTLIKPVDMSTLLKDINDNTLSSPNLAPIAEGLLPKETNICNPKLLLTPTIIDVQEVIGLECCSDLSKKLLESKIQLAQFELEREKVEFELKKKALELDMRIKEKYLEKMESLTILKL